MNLTQLLEPPATPFQIPEAKRNLRASELTIKEIVISTQLCRHMLSTRARRKIKSMIKLGRKLGLNQQFSSRALTEPCHPPACWHQCPVALKFNLRNIQDQSKFFPLLLSSDQSFGDGMMFWGLHRIDAEKHLPMTLRCLVV